MRHTLRRFAQPITQLEDRLAPAIITLAINPDTSSLTLSGTIGSVAIQPQGTDSLKTKYTGTSQVDVDFNTNTIKTLPAFSVADANVNGNWTPVSGGGSGTAPADYGGKALNIPVIPPLIFADVFVALRGIKGSLESTTLSLTGSGNTRTFPSTQTFVITEGVADYTAGVLGSGTESLVGNMATNQAGPGSVTINPDGTCALFVPIDVTIIQDVQGQPATFNIKGQFNATTSIPVLDLNGAGSGENSTWTFPAGGPATKIAPAGTITRNPNANLAAMSVALVARPDGVFESLSTDVSGTGLTLIPYDSATGLLQVTGIGTIATYQSVLQKITYNDIKALPTPGARTVFVAVADSVNASLVRTAAGSVTVPGAKVSAIVVGDGTAQRSRVTEIKLTFDQKVTLPGTVADAFTLVRQGDSAVVALNGAADNSGPGTVVTLTFTGGPLEFGSLADGRYTLTGKAGQINGGNFDGNGDGTSGDDYVVIGTPGVAPNLFRIFGDANGDGSVSTGDFNAFRTAFGGASAIFDFDNLGGVGTTDFNAFRARFGSSI